MPSSNPTVSVITAGASVALVLAALTLSKWSQPPPIQTSNDDDDKGRTARSHHEEEDEKNDKKNSEIEDEEEEDESGALTLEPIGHVESIYRLCVGTPRQGLLAPNARGTIVLTGNGVQDLVDGLEQFTHIWVLFWFHLNTTISSNKGGSTRRHTKQQQQQRSTSKNSHKIAPPALGGKKVGVLATRSPHRPVPLGLSLCQLDEIVLPDKNSKVAKSQHRVELKISGLDLVDGTPVLDIKPYVPYYDSPINGDGAQIPQWVADGLATRRRVQIEPTARQELEGILNASNSESFSNNKNGSALQFYDSIDDTLACITQVLEVDVRSAWQTKKARQGKSQAERARRMKEQWGDKTANGTEGRQATDTATSRQCTQQLDNLLIHYSVMAPLSGDMERDASKGSGAEDTVTVHSIQLLTKPGTTDAASNDDTIEETQTIETPTVETSTATTIVDESGDLDGNAVDDEEKVESFPENEMKEASTDVVELDDEEESLSNQDRDANGIASKAELMEVDKTDKGTTSLVESTDLVEINGEESQVPPGEDTIVSQEDENPKENAQQEEEEEEVTMTTTDPETTTGTADAAASAPSSSVENGLLQSLQQPNATSSDSEQQKETTTTTIDEASTPSQKGSMEESQSISDAQNGGLDQTITKPSTAIQKEATTASEAPSSVSSTKNKSTPTVSTKINAARAFEPAGIIPPSPSATVLSPAMLKKRPNKTRNDNSWKQPSSSTSTTTTTTAAPKSSSDDPTDSAPMDAEYKILKSYWANAAKKNTPTGLKPEAEAQLAASVPTKKLFGNSPSFGS